MSASPQVTAPSVQSEELAEFLFAASQDVFTSMLSCELTRTSGPFTDRKEPFDGVLSLIGFAGKVIGNGTVICSAETACDLSSRLLMTEFPSVDEQVLDSLGEITNMILGGFKNLLETRTGSLQMSIPSVVYGKNIAARNYHTEILGGVDCTYQGGKLEVRVRLCAAPDIQSEHKKRSKPELEIRY